MRWFDTLKSVFVFSKRSKGGKEINKDIHLDANTRDPEKLFLFQLNGDDELIITAGNLLCIKSSGNSSVIYYLKDDVVKTQASRKSLKYYTSLLQAKSRKIIRCHKCYIVNLNCVDKISGTTKGYKIHIEGLDFVIPVSRRLGIDDLNQLNLFSV